MHGNKEIKRNDSVIDERSLEADYRTLVPILKPGLQVLDVGCGTGAISSGVAKHVGQEGHVTGIDNTEKFIVSGKEKYQHVGNLELIHSDLFSFQPDKKFDLIICARVLQWLNNPLEALLKLKSWLKPGGTISVLDYNHEEIEWKPAPPESMQQFYNAFLQWRAKAGMNNRIADDLSDYFSRAGLTNVEVLNANEIYRTGETAKLGIWSKVAELTQIVEEGFVTEEVRVRAIAEYNRWIVEDAREMMLKLRDVRGTF